MKKTKNVFIEDLHMETQTIFYANGDININPCGFELGKHIVCGGTCASQKGRMVTEDDGTSRFHAYAKDSGSRYRLLTTTEHGELKASLQQVIVRIALPKRMTPGEMADTLQHEAGQMARWINES